MSGPGRQLCPSCTRPCTACICRWVTPVASQVQVLILQHPMEVSNAKGSARLLHMSLSNSQVLVGEAFPEGELADALHKDGRTPVLLYPESEGERQLGLRAPPPLQAEMLQDPSRLRLVILDGTWRKSRKMLYMNAALQTLPRLALDAVPASHYLIRKAHAAHQLSTLEATCYALDRLHDGAASFAPLIDAFDGFVSHFQATSGKLAESTS